MADFNPLENHAVQTSLNNLFALEGNEKFSSSNNELDPTHRWSVERVFVIGHEAQLALQRVKPHEMNLSALDGIANGAQSATNELNNFLSNNNAAHINNARNQAESAVLVNLKRLLPIGFPVHPKTEAALEAYRKKASIAKRRQEQETKSLRQEIAELRKALEAERTTVENLSAEVRSTKTENEGLVSELRQADLMRVESTIAQDKELLVKREERLEEHFRNQDRKLSENLRITKESADEALSSLNSKRNEASNIVQSVGDLLTTGTYADRANKETQKADSYRRITVGLFAFGLLIIVSNYIIFAVGSALDADVHLAEGWQSLAARIATGLAVTLPAFYTARESARHRTNADVAKQRELELTTLGPFIELLPLEQKSAIRDRLTDRYFGGEIAPHDVQAPIDVDAVIKLLTEVSKASKDKLA